MIRECTPCKPASPAAAYQDKKYGKNQRVHTTGEKKLVDTCTVCGSQKPMNRSDKGN